MSVPSLLRFLGLAGASATLLSAAPTVTRLTPPSGLFSYGDPAPPYIGRFFTGQRFDLQATIRPDAGQTIASVEFLLDGATIPGSVTLAAATSAAATGSTVGTRRAFSSTAAGVHTLTVRARQSNGATVSADGNFEIVSFTTENGTKARNIILMIGDGMGIAHRTAARLMLHGATQGKALAPLAMDTFPATALVQTASLDSIVTDSAPGAAAYATGNKNHNGEEGVFPDDTVDRFDNPRIESIGEYLARTQNKWLGLVTTADVTDATPAAFSIHTQDRNASTGIADQIFDETAAKANLRVLLGGGRRWFLPDSTLGSGRNAETDYELPADLVAGWGGAKGTRDASRNLLNDFRGAGFTYVGTSTQLKAISADTSRLLGLFQLGNLNAALDKIGKRRGRTTVVDDFGFPDQPMLDEMTDAALAVLKQNASGFVLMIEGGSIDKQAHNMDTERWLHEVIEFDRAVARAKAFAQTVPDTLVIVTADHETGGVNVIGASTVTQSDLALRANGGGVTGLRDQVVGVYSAAGFPNYRILADGYPDTTNVDHRMLVGYAANGDRYENWQTSPKPLYGPVGYPQSTLERDVAGGFLVTGQIPGTGAVHTGSDVPLSAFGVGAAGFAGVMDNTEVFFKTMQLAVGGVPSSTTAAQVRSAPVAAATGQRTAADRLVNLSSRGLASSDNPLVNGFVLAGTQVHRLLIRGVGPALAAYGVGNVLADPSLRLTDDGGAVWATNDDWDKDDDAVAISEAAKSVGAFALASGSKDAAVLVTLPPGRYTVELSGVGGASGVALLEIYELP